MYCGKCGAELRSGLKFCTKCGHPTGETADGAHSKPNFVTLACPTCGGQLRITEDIDRFACAHCGNEHIVKRSGGIVVLAPVVEKLETIIHGTDRMASELAINRLNIETRELEGKIAKLAEEAVASDHFGMKAALFGERLVSFRQYLASESEESARRCSERLVSASAAQASDLIKAYERQATFKTKKIKRTANILRNIHGLKDQVEENQDQVEYHRSIIDRPPGAVI